MCKGVKIEHIRNVTSCRSRQVQTLMRFNGGGTRANKDEHKTRVTSCRTTPKTYTGGPLPDCHVWRLVKIIQKSHENDMARAVPRPSSKHVEHNITSSK